MSPRPLDAPPEVAERQFELYRKMRPADKAQRVSDLTRTSCQLALSGLRRRYPAADERELLLRLAVLRLGAETVERVYGWRDGA